MPNVSDLWIDPWTTERSWRKQSRTGGSRDDRLDLHHQVCTLPRSVWAFARRSISDWKTEYVPNCERCAARDNCGFFASCVQRKRYSTHIQAVQ